MHACEARQSVPQRIARLTSWPTGPFDLLLGLVGFQHVGILLLGRLAIEQTHCRGGQGQGELLACKGAEASSRAHC